MKYQKLFKSLFILERREYYLLHKIHMILNQEHNNTNTILKSTGLPRQVGETYSLFLDSSFFLEINGLYKHRHLTKHKQFDYELRYGL